MTRKFTVVEWLDPADRDSGWLSEEDVKRISAAAVVSTYGEIIEEDETFLKVAYNVEDATRSVNSDGIITKSTIVRRRDYTYPWKSPWKGNKKPKKQPDKKDEKPGEGTDDNGHEGDKPT